MYPPAGHSNTLTFFFMSLTLGNPCDQFLHEIDFDELDSMPHKSFPPTRIVGALQPSNRSPSFSVAKSIFSMDASGHTSTSRS